MQAAVARVRDHQVVFCGLEVLRLIGERVEESHEVDVQDLRVVLSFMRDVAHRCLDNTEDILRLAASIKMSRSTFKLDRSWKSWIRQKASLLLRRAAATRTSYRSSFSKTADAFLRWTAI